MKHRKLLVKEDMGLLLIQLIGSWNTHMVEVSHQDKKETYLTIIENECYFKSISEPYLRHFNKIDFVYLFVSKVNDNVYQYTHKAV